MGHSQEGDRGDDGDRGSGGRRGRGNSMRVVPERPFGLQILAVFGGLIAGPYAAHRLAAALAPGSELVETVGVFAFALIFVGGTLLWMGIGMAAVVIGGVWRLVRGRKPGPEGLTSSNCLVPPGYRSYIVVGIGLGLTVGLVAGVATELSVSAATGIWTLAGLAYGFLLWAAAHHGYLPIGEPQ